jgi:hypothetical protein
MSDLLFPNLVFQLNQNEFDRFVTSVIMGAYDFAVIQGASGWFRSINKLFHYFISSKWRPDNAVDITVF